MNQIPNIEKTMRRGIKLIAGRIEALHPQYFLDETTYKHDVKGTMDVVKGVMADIEETHHQQLQKAREEEKMGILKIALTMGDCPINNPKADAGWMKFQHDFCLKLTKDNKKSILSETDHSELDQDTELLNSVKEDWDKQAKNAMNGLDQDVSK